MPFALINGGIVRQIADVQSPVNAAMVWADAGTSGAQPGWTAVETAGTWSFAAPAAPSGPPISAIAQAALDSSDMTAMRCFKAAVAFPATWQAYCSELRAIVSGTASPMPTSLPAQPAYPSGS